MDEETLQSIEARANAEDIPALIAEIRRYREALGPDYDIDDIPDLIRKSEYVDGLP